MATTEPIPTSSLTQPPLNATFMGVVIGAAEHYGTGLSAAEYFAESGFAYAVNIHPVICPSGPYVWNHEPILDALRQLGIDGERVGSGYDSQTRAAREAIEATVQAGFGEAVVSMEGLEHQLIVDSNSERMTFAMPWGNEAESCMKEMVCEDWRSVKEPPPFGFYRFDACDVAPKETRIRLAIDTALAAYESPSKFETEDYKYGLNAYGQWIDALKVESEDTHGQWWNCVVWSECRHFASEYFRDLSIDAKDQTDELANLFQQSSDLLMQASAHELLNDQKSALIQEVEAIETRIPALLREIRSKLS